MQKQNLRFLLSTTTSRKGLIKNLKNIDFSSLIHYEEKIGGLAILEDQLVLTYLGKDREGKEAIVFQNEVSLAVGTIENGVLKNPDQLLSALKKLTENKKLPSQSVVVSLPTTAAQLFVFEFFPNLKPEEINKAIDLIIDSSLPLAKEKIYPDWEEIKEEKFEKKKYLLAMGVKEIIDPYLETIKKTGLAPVAVETHSWSLERSLDLKNEPSITAVFFANRIIFSVYKNNSLVFQFDLSKTEAKPNDYLQRLLYFLESDNNFGFNIKNLFILGEKELTAKKIFQKIGLGAIKIIEEEKAKIFSEGAAKRGLISRKEDTISSLMPIGTELAYERQRLISFLDFFQKLVIAFGSFFVVLFLGELLLVNIIARNASRSLIEEQTIIPQELMVIKEAAGKFNERIGQLAQIVKEAPQWENLFQEIDKLINSGLIVDNLSVGIDQPVSLSGTARTRESLLQLKSSLENSQSFLPITLPLSTLIGKENIGFSVKLELKNARMIYK